MDLKISRGEDRQVKLEPLTAPAEINEVRKTQLVNIPGKETVTQPVVQEYF